MKRQRVILSINCRRNESKFCALKHVGIAVDSCQEQTTRSWCEYNRYLRARDTSEIYRRFIAPSLYSMTLASLSSFTSRVLSFLVRFFHRKIFLDGENNIFTFHIFIFGKCYSENVTFEFHWRNCMSPFLNEFEEN